MKLHGMVVTGMWMAASAVCLGSQDRWTVVVLNYAGMGNEELEQAITLSRRLFQRIGVETTWSVCPRFDGCTLPPVGSYVRMSVVPWNRGPVLGFASTDSMAVGSPQAYAFHGPVSRVAKKTGFPSAVVLARVMVHEILHLFGLEHAPHGIMRESIDTQELANLASAPMLIPAQLRHMRDGISTLRPAGAEVASR